MKITASKIKNKYIFPIPSNNNDVYKYIRINKCTRYNNIKYILIYLILTN